MHSGVFADVFIWYNAPNNLLLARIYKFTLARLKRLCGSDRRQSYHKTLKDFIDYYLRYPVILRTNALAIVSRVKNQTIEVGAPLYEKTSIPSEYVSELCEVNLKVIGFGHLKTVHILL